MAAPGVKPFKISAAAIGTDAVAQTYIGIPTTIITAIAKNQVPNFSAKNPCGSTAEIPDAVASPKSRGPPMSRGNVTNP